MNIFILSSLLPKYFILIILLPSLLLILHLELKKKKKEEKTYSKLLMGLIYDKITLILIDLVRWEQLRNGKLVLNVLNNQFGTM